MSVLAVKDLAFSYGTHRIFSNVTFSVEAGQIFCLVGPNGCGKTTLAHCILSHLKPEKGTVFVQGRDIAEYAPRQLAEQIAYVPQNHTRSFPYRTLDVVAMGRTRMQKLMKPGTSHQDEALHYMEQLGIGHLAQTEYTTLSGGELQMVLLARALTQQSNILVMDEPAAHLDIKRTQDVLLVLTKLAKEQGKTVLLSTHDFNHPLLFEVEGADVKMALMEKGKISEIGTPVELLSSGLIHDIYNIRSKVLTLSADKPRHYLAAWNEEVE